MIWWGGKIQQHKEVSIGTVPYFIEDNRIKYLIIFTTKSKYWEFPKGHVESNETHHETLKREMLEETGLNEIKIIPGFKHEFVIDLRPEKLHRIINYVVRIEPELIKLSDTHIAHKYVTFEEAMNLFIFDNLKELLQKANAFIMKEHFF